MTFTLNGKLYSKCIKQPRSVDKNSKGSLKMQRNIDIIFRHTMTSIRNELNNTIAFA